MGHRTLLAYDRDGYDLHYAHWGVDPDSLTPETPFGGPPENGWARVRASDLLDPEGGHLGGDHDTAVDPDPMATGLSFAEVCDRVDPLEHEELYVISADFEVRTYLVFAVGASTGSTSTALRTVLVGYDGEADATYLRGWLTGARAVRDVNGFGSDSVVRALRWLDPDRGTLIYLDDERGA